MNSTLTLTQEWDKTFPQNAAVDHSKVTFHNRFGIELAADLYKPKGAQGPFAAVAVSGPFGAVKEQCSGLYAQELAARGFLTVAFDPSYTGESGGTPRCVASPDINTEDFSAAVDFLSVRDDVGAHRHPRHLRLGRHGAQRCRHRHTHQGHRHVHDVRHDPRDRQRLL